MLMIVGWSIVWNCVAMNAKHDKKKHDSNKNDNLLPNDLTINERYDQIQWNKVDIIS